MAIRIATCGSSTTVGLTASPSAVGGGTSTDSAIVVGTGIGSTAVITTSGFTVGFSAPPSIVMAGFYSTTSAATFVFSAICLALTCNNSSALSTSSSDAWLILLTRSIGPFVEVCGAVSQLPSALMTAAFPVVNKVRNNIKTNMMENMLDVFPLLFSWPNIRFDI